MSLLVCLGMVVKDIVFRVPTIPALPQKLTAHELRCQFGGMAATAAASAAALGGNVEFWGRIGDDESGQEALHAFSKRGVKTRVSVTVGTKSPMSAVIVDDAGERMLAVYAGQLDPATDWLPLENLHGVGAVHADFRWAEGACALYQAARLRGIPRVLDADAGNNEAVRSLIGLADHVIFSERGLKGIAGDVPADQALLHVAMEAAHDPSRVIGVTLGERGSLFCYQSQIHAFPAHRITPIDTNGAGDVFHGAYALSLARGHSWMQSVAYATTAASLKCTRDQGWDQLPDHDEVIAFMKAHS
jgi:sulfofructose kinase